MKHVLSAVELIVSGVFQRGRVPAVYSQLDLTKTEYNVISQLWAMSVDTFISSKRLMIIGGPTKLSKQLGVSLTTYKSTIRALEAAGAVCQTSYQGKPGVRISAQLFNEQVKVRAAQTDVPVQLFEWIWPGDWTEIDLLHIGKLIDEYITLRGINCGNLVYNVCGECPVSRTPITNLFRRDTVRQPIILRCRQSIILDDRTPVQLNNRKPIVPRKAIIIHGSRKACPIRINAPKYNWLTDSQKAELLAIAHLGKDVIKTKLERFKNLAAMKFTEQELDCLDNMIPYYENLICSRTGELEHKLLKNARYKKSPHWKHIWKVWQLCYERGWDWRVYLDSQFESFENWEVKGTYKWPLPNMLYSERAVKAFEAYIYRNETAYQKEGHNIKAVPKNTGNYQQEATKKIKSAVEVIGQDLRRWSQYPMRIFKTVPEKERRKMEKAKSIIDNWMDNLPVEYLATIPEILDYIGDRNEYLPKFQQKIDEIEALQNDIIKIRLLMQIVRAAEKDAGLPMTDNLLNVAVYLGERSA